MEYNHTIKEIAVIVGKTPQSIQKLRSKNLSFFEAHTKSRGRTIYFDEAALDWIKDYYQITADAAEKQPNPPAKQPSPTDAESETTQTNEPQSSAQGERNANTTDAAQEQQETTKRVEELLLRIKGLEEELEKAKKEAEENRQLYRALAIALAQEQNNMRMVLETRKPFLARLKSLFTRQKPAYLSAPTTTAQEGPQEAARVEVEE